MDSWRRRLPTEEWVPSYSGPAHSLPAETLEAAARLLRLLPQLESITLDTVHGRVEVERQATASAWQAADRVALALFASTSDVLAISTSTSGEDRDSRHATPADPFLTRDGARAAAIKASEDLGEITGTEAARRTQARLDSFDEHDPLEDLWLPGGNDEK